MNLWRVYAAEWLAAYTSDAVGDEGTAECERWRILTHAATPAGQCRVVSYPGWPATLEIRRPNLQGEFREQEFAGLLAAQLVQAGREGVVTVQAGSAEEKKLLA